MILEPGSRLGPYEVISPIGAGGMGEVWKARDSRLGRVVAIKRLTALHTDRFEQEARAIAALNHPHICQIHDIGADYLVLEFIDGEPVRGPLPVEDAVRLAAQIAGALDAAHRQGILHRDLKPANILVTKPGGVSPDPPVAKLLDFGLARLISDDADVTRTADGVVMGTAAYMSPEQAEGKPLDARSDIFSFGAVLHEMLSGTRAFAGHTAAQVVSAILRDDPRPLQAPHPLERLVSRCLAKSPGQRFQTMGEVKAALEQILTKPAAQQPSIAVLPFANMSADPENEYFSDGLAEELINLLAHVPNLKVAARTSAFAFRGKQQDIRRIAEALGVRTILEGSVRRAGSRIRVTAQLIDAEDGYHLWSERYDREFTDVFAIQDDIANAIAGALRITLSEKPGAHRRRTPNLAAYEAYLKGRHYLYKMTAESLARSRQFFEQAIDLDRDFAPAHSGLSEYFFVIATMGVMPADEALPQARSEARRALDIDSALPEAHSVLGMVASTFDYDWNVVDREFRLAMAREPVAPYARDNYGAFYLLQIGRVEEAGVEIERALQEDPLNLLFRVHWGISLFAAGRDADAVRQWLEVLEIDQNYVLAQSWLCTAYVSQHMWPEARRYAERAVALWPSPLMVGCLAGILLREGDRHGADRLLDQFKDSAVPGAVLGLALFHLTSLDADEAVVWLEKAIERREAMAMLPVLFRRFCSASPRWPAVAKMLNLPGAT